MAYREPISARVVDRWRARAGTARGANWLPWSLYVAASLAVGRALFWRATSLPFLGDDFNEIGKAAMGPSGGGWFAAGHGVVFLRPVFYASLWIDHALHGTDPAGYHLTNLWLHVACAVLVAGLARELQRALAPEAHRHRTSLPMFAGAAFLVLPSHGEPVYWISARSDLLATALALVSLLLFVRGLDVDGAARPGSRGVILRAGSLVALVLALLAKESAVAVPFVAWLLAAAVAATAGERRDVLRRSTTAVAPHLVTLVAYLALRWVVLGTPVGGYGLEDQVEGGVGRLVRQYLASAGRTVVPSAPLAVWVGLGVSAAVGAATAVVAVALARRCGRRGARSWDASAFGLPAVALAATLVALVPVTGVGASPFGPAGERVVYLPSAFASVLVAAAVVGAIRRRGALVGVCAALALVVLLVGVRESRRWADAGRAAAAVTDDLAARPVGSVVHLVNAPDSVRGAVSFRNSAAGVDRLLRGGQPGSVRVVTSVALDAADQPVDVELRRARTSFVVVMDPPTARALRRTPYVDDLRWDVASRPGGGYEVVVPRSVHPATIRVFAGGELLALGEPGA